MLENNETKGKGILEGKNRTLSWWHICLVSFFLTCGGPYGIEEAVSSAGPLFTLLALAFLPLFWGLPQALMMAELSTMMPENGGSVLWIQRAFGPFFGWINAFLNQFYLLHISSISLGHQI